MAPLPPPPPPLTPPPLTGSPAAFPRGAPRVDIFPGSPWPAFDSPLGPAFAAKPAGDSAAEAPYFAILATTGLPIWGEALNPAMGFRHPNLLRMIDHGTVDWPGRGPTHAYVFARPPGLSVAQLYATPQRAMDEDQLGLRLRPLLAMLGSFGSTGLSHGSLAIQNIFVGPGSLMAGDFAAGPPSCLPGAYLPIERMQADAAGRGAPSQADDYYALGALAVVLSLGFDPTATLTHQELLARKLERGSYNAILGEHRLRGDNAEIARGMLDDNLTRRWALPDIESWLGGRHPTPRAVAAVAQASRPLVINGRGSTAPRAVAQLLAEEESQAITLLEAGELQRWVRRTLDDEELAGALDMELEELRRVGASTKGGGAHASGQALARTLMLLDPPGPVRYRSQSVLPGGYGMFLSACLQQNGDTQAAAELLAHGLLIRWLQLQATGRADHLHLQQLLERARIWLDRKGIGYGIERVLYELAPLQACLSPLVRTAQPTTINALLTALESAANGAGAADPIDRHIAAFLVARDKRITEGLLISLAPLTATSGNDAASRRAIGLLTLLAEAQSRHGPASLPNLGQWLARKLEPAVTRYRLAETQNSLRAQVGAAGAKGDLSELVQLIDNPQTLAADENGFANAQNAWARAEREIAELQGDITSRGELERRIGQPLASQIAVGLGLLALAATVALALIG